MLRPTVTRARLLMIQQMKKERKLRIERGEDPTAIDEDFELREAETHGNTLMMKIIGPIVTFVNTPWKMYPVGVLFGFGLLLAERTTCSMSLTRSL